MYISGQPLLNLASPGYFWPPLIVCLALSHKWQMLLDLHAVLVVPWLSKSLLGNKVGKTGVQDRIQEVGRKEH